MRRACLMFLLSTALMGGLTQRGWAQPEAPAVQDAKRNDGQAAWMAEMKQRAQVVEEMTQRLRDLERQLGKVRDVGGDSDWVGRLFPIPERLGAAGDAVGTLKLPPLLAGLVGTLADRLVVIGPAWVVDFVQQALAALDPTTQPPMIKVEARIYLATQVLPPEFEAPANDPLVEQVRQHAGYPAVALLNVTRLSGMEGDLLQAESEAGLKTEEIGLNSRLLLRATPRVVGDQIHLRLTLQLEAQMGPGMLRRFQAVQALRAPNGRPAFVACTDTMLKTALVLVLTPTLER